MEKTIKNTGINCEKLKAYREKMGLSQVALDRLAGVGLSTTRNAEAGKGITVTTLKALANALGVPAAVFLD